MSPGPRRSWMLVTRRGGRAPRHVVDASILVSSVIDSGDSVRIDHPDDPASACERLSSRGERVV